MSIFLYMGPQLTSSSTSEPRKYHTKDTWVFIYNWKIEKTLKTRRQFLIHLGSKLNQNDMRPFFDFVIFFITFICDY